MIVQTLIKVAPFPVLVILWILPLSISTNLLAEVVDRVAVVIDGEPHTLTEIKTFAGRKMRRDLALEDLVRVDSSSKKILEEFITDRLLSSEAKRLGIKIRDEDIDQYILAVQNRTGLTKTQLNDVVRREGMDIEQYRASIKKEIKKRELINRQVNKKVNIMESDVKRYYQANRKKYMRKEKVRLFHILIRILKNATSEEERAAVTKANRIREEILKGKEFSILAQENSEGGRTSNGGDIGWVERKSLLKEIAEVAFKLPKGDVSPVIRTSLGVHLIKVEERQPASIEPLSKVAKIIKADLRTKTLNERFEKWLRTDLRKKHRVVVRLDGFVFRVEKAKEGTVRALMVSKETPNSNERSSVLSYLNPFSYIMSEAPIEDEGSKKVNTNNIISIFGVPLFVSESDDETMEGAVILPDEAGQVNETAEGTEESPSIFSSILDTVNPF